MFRYLKFAVDNHGRILQWRKVPSSLNIIWKGGRLKLLASGRSIRINQYLLLWRKAVRSDIPDIDKPYRPSFDYNPTRDV
ncbi:hypothetical protein CRYUN_Cryun01aG0108100 [Craigia yunnanensis]